MDRLRISMGRESGVSSWGTSGVESSSNPPHPNIPDVPNSTAISTHSRYESLVQGLERGVRVCPKRYMDILDVLLNAAPVEGPLRQWLLVVSPVSHSSLLRVRGEMVIAHGRARATVPRDLTSSDHRMSPQTPRLHRTAAHWQSLSAG